MAAEKGNAALRLGLRGAGGMADNLGIEALPSLGRKRGRMSRRGAGRLARALFADGGEACLIGGGPLHPSHAAMMLAIAAAAGGKSGLGVRGKKGRDQHPTEEHQQGMCNRSAHGLLCESIPERVEWM